MIVRELIKAYSDKLLQTHSYEIRTYNEDGTFKMDKVGQHDTKLRSRAGKHFEKVEYGTMTILTEAEFQEWKNVWNSVRLSKGFKAM